jgi:hypothetical protein
MAVTVKRIDAGTYEVTVEGRTTSTHTVTTHTVTLIAAYYQKLTQGKGTPEQLIERSFEFLLEREPNTSILRRFDLPVIQTYFPEYESAMRDLAE